VVSGTVPEGAADRRMLARISAPPMDAGDCPPGFICEATGFCPPCDGWPKAWKVSSLDGKGNDVSGGYLYASDWAYFFCE
jgi:hypothetical protein